LNEDFIVEAEMDLSPAASFDAVAGTAAICF
jgi:hypothetical protein